MPKKSNLIQQTPDSYGGVIYFLRELEKKIDGML